MENYLRSFNILNDQEVQSLLRVARYQTLGKNDFFIKAGQVCKEVAFVKSGFFRSFYYSSAGEEVTYCFTFSNNFVTAYSSFTSQSQTEENIHAMTDAEIFIIPEKEIVRLENSSSNWLRLSKLIAEEEFRMMEKRVFMLLTESAERRYKDMLDNYPEYLQLIPLNYLASYLGITQRHLSRIRKSFTF